MHHVGRERGVSAHFRRLMSSPFRERKCSLALWRIPPCSGAVFNSALHVKAPIRRGTRLCMEQHTGPRARAHTQQ